MLARGGYGTQWHWSDRQPVTWKIELTGVGVGADSVGVGVILVLVGAGVGVGLVLVIVAGGDGLVIVTDGDGLVIVADGDGLVVLGDGDGLVVLGDGDGLVVLGDGDGLVVLGDGDGLVVLGDGDGLVVLGDGDGLVVLGDGDGDAPQLGAVMVSSSRVTAAFWASTRPSTVTPVVTVIDVRASTLPRKAELVPSVAELPTCQKTLQAEAPFVRRTELAESVTRVEPTWKTNTASALPCASRMSAPPTSSEESALYTPGPRVWPAPMNEPTLAAGVSAAATLYAVVKSDWAPEATPSALCTAPVTMPLGAPPNPVTAVPGLTPRSPLTRVGPVLVTVDPARTPKLPAVPRPTATAAALAVDWLATSTAAEAMSTSNTAGQE